MKEITVQILDKDYPFFIELVKKLPFVKKVKATSNPAKTKIISDLQESIDELKLIKAGKKKGISARELFKEL